MFGCLHLFDQGLSAFGCLLLITVSLPFDQPVTLTSKTQVPTFTGGFVSTYWSANDTDFKNLSFGCLCLSIRMFSIFWSANDTDFKNLSSNFHWRELSPPFDQQVILTSKTYVCVSPPFHHGVSAFCSASDIDLKTLVTPFMWGLSQPFDQQVTLTSKT